MNTIDQKIQDGIYFIDPRYNELTELTTVEYSDKIKEVITEAQNRGELWLRFNLNFPNDRVIEKSGCQATNS